MAMTHADIIQAAEESLALARREHLDTTDFEGVPAGTYEHWQGMLNRMREDPSMSQRKLGSWLGWIQGCIYMASCGAVTLDEFKEINYRNSDNTRKA